jgi:hypothetical protein
VVDVGTEIASRAGRVLDECGCVVADSDIVSFVEDLLHGDRQLLGCLHEGIITSREVANALAARISTWASHVTGDAAVETNVGAWEPFVAAVTAILDATA